MLAMIVAWFLLCLAMLLCVCGGELRYEKQKDYPGNQRGCIVLASVFGVLAICCARYL